MPSIFIWKATAPNPSKKCIRCYSGSNWVVEDTDSSSHSYQYLQQIVIPGFNHDSVITFLAKTMPQDWVGSDLLEVHHVPYHLIRSDAYGTLEHIGYWMRFTSREEINDADFTRDALEVKWKAIQAWVTQPSATSAAPSMRPLPSVMRRENTRPTHRPSRPPVAIPSISMGALQTIDPQQVRQSFQEFYAAVALPVQGQQRPHPRPRHSKPRGRAHY